MVHAAAVTDELAAAARAFGMRDAGRLPLAPRWGLLFEQLDDTGDADYVCAIELIYEGYLFHYRESRVCASPGGCRESALLAGDFFYARGLRIIATRGDAEAVGLLARLMASCSYLRSIAAPFAADDALWAAAMGGLAALRRGASPVIAAAAFDRFDAIVAAGGDPDVAALAREQTRRLGLRDATPLEQALAGDARPAPAAVRAG